MSSNTLNQISAMPSSLILQQSTIITLFVFRQNFTRQSKWNKKERVWKSNIWAIQCSSMMGLYKYNDIYMLNNDKISRKRHWHKSTLLTSLSAKPTAIACCKSGSSNCVWTGDLRAVKINPCGWLQRLYLPTAKFQTNTHTHTRSFNTE